MKKFLTLFIILGITSCTNETTDSETVSIDKDKTYNWRLVTSWPKIILALEWRLKELLI